MVTIKDIATKLDVSPAAVSLALNGKGRVSEEMRALIKETADEMGYVPSIAAKAMRTRHSNTIGVVVGTINNEFFIKEIQAISDVASERGYSLFICDAGHDSRQATENIKALRARGVDGIIISFGFYAGDDFIKEVMTCIGEGIRVISLTNSVTGEEIPTVHFSSKEQIDEVVGRLVELGHREVGCLTSEKDTWLDKNRFTVFRTSMEKLGIYKEENVVRFDIFEGSVGEKVRLLLDRNPNISAIFAINDYVAVQAHKAILEMGKRIPEDISIVGFDGIASAEYVTPSITTIATPEKIGTSAANNLIEWLEAPENGQPEDVLLPCTIRWRGSLDINRKTEKV